MLQDLSNKKMKQKNKTKKERGMPEILIGNIPRLIEGSLK